MKDRSRSDQKLIDEISVLKQRIRELEKASSEKIREENERRARQLTVMHETSVELTAELNLDELLHSIAQRALNLIGGASCNCYLYNPQADLLEQVASAGTALVPSPITRRRGEGMVGQVWVKGTPLLVNDYASWPGRTRAYDSFPSRALVAAPFLLGTEVLGVLNIMANLPHQYTRMDVEMLSLFAAQAAIAIRNARLHDRMKMELADRRRAEEALRESEEKYRLLVENANEALYVLQDGIFRYANRICGEMLGVPVAELIGVSMLEFLNPDDREKAISQHLRILRGELAAGRSDFRVLTRHGKERWADVNSVGIVWDGKTATLNFATDITDRKQAEEALAKSEEKFRKAFYTSPDSVDINRLEDGMYISINPGFTRLTGYTEEDIIGKTSIEYNIWENIEDRQRLVAGLRNDGEVANLEAAFRMKGGDLRYGLMSASVINLNGVPHILSITRDITERKQAERRLQDTLGSLRKAVSTTIQVMVSAVETRDPYTAGHQIRSADLARAIATEMGLPQDTIEGIRMASSIHDIGKLSIPAEILSKPTKLTEIEFSLIREHARKGFEILKEVESPWPLAEIVYQHHERMDGSGYPRNLKRDDILIEARILTVADVVEAMASHRPYRPGLGIEAALNEIEKNRGIFYDNAVAEACLRLFQEKGFNLGGT